MLQQVGDPRRVDRLVALLHQHLDGKLDHQGDQLEGPGAERVSILSRVSSISLQGQAHKGAVQHGGQQLELGVGRGVRDADQLVFTTLLSVITTAIKAFSSTISRSYRFTVTRIRGAAAVKTG